MEINNIKQTLNNCENVLNNPELILTDLFTNDIDNDHLVSKISINGKSISEYLIDYLLSLNTFENTSLIYSCYNLNVYAPSLSEMYFNNKYNYKDHIITINIQKRTFSFCNKSIEEYTKIMNEHYELKTYELSDFWKRYENYTLKNRVKSAFNSLTENKKLSSRLSNFLFYLTVSKKKIDTLINKEKDKMKIESEYNQRLYDNQIDLQNYYIENAPNHIEMIKPKQEEIANYLKQLGYVEVKVA